MIKECLECGLEFKVVKARAETAKYCCLTCRVNSQKSVANPLRKRVLVNCKQCNDEFERMNYQTTEYCSRQCYWDYRNQNPDVQFQSNQVVNLIEKECLNCLLPYKVNQYRKHTSKFCSVACHDNYRRKTLICPSCKEAFEVANYIDRKYCSERCAINGVGKRRSKFSIDIYNFLSKFYNVEDEFYLRYDSGKYFIDSCLTDYNIMVECNGDYWHCNPKIYDESYFHKKIRLTAKEIWDKDLVRKNRLNSLGYSVITLWEYDWNNNEDFFNNLKKNIEDEICKDKIG